MRIHDRRRMREAVFSNLRQYLIMGIICVIVALYVVISKDMFESFASDDM